MKRALFLSSAVMAGIVLLVGLGAFLAVVGAHPGIAVGVPFGVGLWAWLVVMFRLNGS